MVTNYQRGYQVELQAKAELIMNGFQVIRATGSQSPADLVATSAETVRFIQVKRTKSRVNSQLKIGIREIKTLVVPIWATREVWVWKDRFGFEVRQIVV